MTEAEQLRAALENIKKHLELSIGEGMLQYSSVYRMVCDALNERNCNDRR